MSRPKRKRSAEAAETPGRLGRAISSWFLPDLSLTVALAAVVYCLTVYNAPVRMFGDSDPGWHTVAGEQMLRTGHIPRVDTFSFLNTGHGWYSWEWLAEIVMALFHRWLGLSGLVLLFTVAIGVSLWMCFRLHLRLGGDFFLACVMALPLVTTAEIHWLARPHVLSYLFLLALVFYLERAGERFSARDAMVMAFGTALWAGIHGSFVLAPAIALLYAAGHAAATLWKDADVRREWRMARWFLLAAVCSAAGTPLNPYGLALHSHLLHFSTAQIAPHIREWRPPSMSGPAGWLLLLTTGLGVAGALLALWQRKVAHFLVCAFLIVLALKAARGLPLMALVALPMANAAITGALQRIRHRASLAGWAMGISAEMRSLDRGHHGAALALLAAIGVFSWLLQPEVVARTGFHPARYPVEAASTVAALPSSSRIFADFPVGGYFIYRFDGRRRVWFDGRVDFFGPEPLLQFEQISQLRPGWRDAMDKIGFTHAVTYKRDRLAHALMDAGWRPLFTGRLWIVLENPASARVADRSGPGAARQM